MAAEYRWAGHGRRLRQAPVSSDGFAAPGERGRLGPTVEALVSQPRYFELFTDVELRTARYRLEQFGYESPPSE